METSKARQRRKREGFFEKFIHGKGIDVGCGRLTVHGIDLIHPDALPHDQDICDATLMNSYGEEEFDYVYSSHLLEHLTLSLTAIQNWFRILKKGGHLIICVPHRDLYERKAQPPSRWNSEHKRFYTPASLLQEIEEALSPNTYSLVYCKDLREGWSREVPLEEHPVGEYSIECVLQKLRV